MKKQVQKDRGGMLYECLDCGSIFKEEDGKYAYGYLVCPSCGSEDLIVVWDGQKPVKDFAIEKELDDLKAMRGASSIRG